MSDKNPNEVVPSDEIAANRALAVIDPHTHKTVAAPYGFYDEGGILHMWEPGHLINEEDIDLLTERGVELVDYEG